MMQAGAALQRMHGSVYASRRFAITLSRNVWCRAVSGGAGITASTMHGVSTVPCICVPVCLIHRLRYARASRYSSAMIFIRL